jgi:hypothetical protein
MRAEEFRRTPGAPQSVAPDPSSRRGPEAPFDGARESGARAGSGALEAGARAG